LNARRVELGATLAVGKVQSDDLMSDEVSTSLEILGNTGRIFLSIHEILLDPVSIGLATSLIDLKPLGIGSIEFVAAGGTARSHVGHDRTGVVGPVGTIWVTPGERDLAARVDIRNERGGLCALAAHHVFVAGSFNRVDRVDQTDRRWVALSVGSVALVRLSIDSEFSDETVGFNRGQHGGEEGDERKNGD